MGDPFHLWLKKNSGCQGEDLVAPAILFSFCEFGTIFDELTFNFFDKSVATDFEKFFFNFILGIWSGSCQNKKPTQTRLILEGFLYIQIYLFPSTYKFFCKLIFIIKIFESSGLEIP